MKSHPIIFQGPMVRAILEDRKTVTRRPVKFPKYFSECCDKPDRDYWGDYYKGGYMHTSYCKNCDAGGHRTSPRWEIGDELWVREKWKYLGTKYKESGPILLKNATTQTVIKYAADESQRIIDIDTPWRRSYGRDGWLTPIHMPRWACRIEGIVKDVRPVQDIPSMTEAEARLEGFDDASEFRAAWDAMYREKPEYSVEANPWVWRIESVRKERE